MNAGRRASALAPGTWMVLAVLLLCACAPENVSAPSTTQVMAVYGTAAAQPWLTKLYDCAAGQSAVLSKVNDPQSAAIVLRLGELQGPATSAFQVGHDTLEVWTNVQNPVTSLSAPQVRQLFSGEIRNWVSIGGTDAQVNVWVYAEEDDVQQAFETTSMAGNPITSLARLATSPNEMEQAIADDKDAIGILSGGLASSSPVAGGHSVYTSGSVPVLAITPAEPQGTVKDLLGCMQK